MPGGVRPPRAPSRPDAGLRALFRRKLPQLQWTTIETGATQLGVPDSEFAYRGAQGWIEFKATWGWAVGLTNYQIGFHARREREGCASFVVVRRRAVDGPQTIAADDLYVFAGGGASLLKMQGLRGRYSPKALHISTGGPAAWDWAAVLECLTRR